MAQKILYVNPIKRKKVKAVATRKRKRITKKRRNPVAETPAANPIKRKAVSHRRRRRRNPIAANPIRKIGRRVARTQKTGVMTTFIKPAAFAAGGGVLMDVLWNNLPLPASVKQGSIQYVAKAAGAVAMVEGAKFFTTKQNAERLGVGALTILMHDLFRMGIRKAVPSLKMGEYVDGLGEYVDGLGEYVGAGGGLDFDMPLSFYETAGQGANTVPNFPAYVPNPAMAVPVPNHVADTVGDFDGADDLGGYGYSD